MLSIKIFFVILTVAVAVSIILYGCTKGTHKAKVIWELDKNAVSFLEQFLEVAPHKIAVLQSLTSHFKNHQSQSKKRCGILPGETRTNS